MAEHRPIMKNNQNTHYSFIFQDRLDLRSAALVESSRRDLLNDMTEHGPISKNNQNTHPCFSSNTQNRYRKQVFRFYCVHNTLKLTYEKYVAHV